MGEASCRVPAQTRYISTEQQVDTVEPFGGASGGGIIAFKTMSQWFHAATKVDHHPGSATTMILRNIGGGGVGGHGDEGR